MTDQLRQAAQQALEALELSAVTVDSFGVQKATQAAITALRTALEQQQQAGSVSMRMPRVGDKVICLEDESLGEVVSLTAGGSPDIAFADGSHGTYLLREFAELFGYVASPLPVQPEPLKENPQWTPDWNTEAVLVEEMQRMAKRVAELEALLERQTARIVDLQTHIENFDGDDR